MASISYPIEINPAELHGAERPDAATPIIGRLRAQRLVDLYAMQIAPALAATLVGLSHLPDPPVAIALGVLALAANLLFARVRFPFQLMPVARFCIRIAAPVIAALLVVPMAAYGGHPIALYDLIPSIVAATLMTSLGAWFKVRFDASAEVRIGVIGCPSDAESVATEISAAGVGGYRVVGAIVPHGGCPKTARGKSIIGELSSLRPAVKQHSLDLLVSVAGGEATATSGAAVNRAELFEHASEACLGLPVRMLQLSQFCEDVLGHVPVGSIDSGWFQYLMHPRFRGDVNPGKRMFDLVLSGVVGILALPVLGVLAIAIKLSDGGPVLYRQPRVGAAGRKFQIVKLRTMTVDAERDGVEEWSHAGDSRVTRVGRVLRASHLDELPQLWNVIKGEMTLVGPRPERPGKVAELECRFRYYERRHLAKPGITGWAQVRCGYSGSELGTAWKLCHDLYYLKHRSLLGDVLLIIETLRTVGDGAQNGTEAPDRRFILGEVQAG
ncbi:MAG: exopolysaccharide biosynthesis polyprenyl glycosylphosphotransferase [Solirubrobacterales bacterium]